MASSEIQKYENNESLIKQALSSPPACQSGEKDMTRVLFACVAKAYFDSGFKFNDEDVVRIVESLSREVLKQVPTIRLQEIPIAINKGVFGEYGEYFGLNVVTFIRFLKKYIQSEERVNEAFDASRLLLPEKLEPSEEEVKKSVKKAIVRAFEKYKTDGYYEDYGNFIYNNLDKFGLVALTNNRKQEIFQKAKDKLLIQASDVKNLSDFKKVKNIIKSINEETPDGRDLVKIEAKKIALQEVFKDFEEIDTDIEELINQENF